MINPLRLFPFVRRLENTTHRALDAAEEALRQRDRLQVSLNSVNSVLRQTQGRLQELSSPRWALVQGMTNDQAFYMGREHGVKSVVSKISEWTHVTLPDGRTLQRDNEDYRFEVSDGHLKVYAVYFEDEIDAAAEKDILVLCSNLEATGHAKVAEQLADLVLFGDGAGSRPTSLEVQKEDLEVDVSLDDCIFQATIQIPAGTVK